MTYSFSKYEQQGISTRSNAASGVDIFLAEMGDIEVVNGDFRLVKGNTNIVKAFLRRLNTPPYGYKRFMRTFTGITEIGETYGNDMYFYLSAPITTLSLESILKALEEAAREDQRIEVMDIGVAFKSINQVYIQKFKYIIKGEDELRSLSLVLDNGINNV